MDLIYADVINGTIYDKGVLNNYTFDMSFGEKENDFELKAPLEGTRLYEDQIIYISGTEYGGIIDSVTVDTSNRLMIYSGRTWHGILESKIIYPLKGYDYMYLNGDANEVLAYLLERMNIIPGDANELYVQPESSFMTVSSEESGIEIDMKVTSESGNYAHGYTFIRDMLYANGAKLQIIDGVLSAVELVDYSNDDDFIEGTDQFVAKRKYNSLNHFHCMGQGNLANRYTIDLYLDNNGGLLPYCRSNPVQDSDYYTDISALAESTNEEDIENFETISSYMVTGEKEIAEIYDYPSIGNTYHYVVLDTVPSDWSTDLTPAEDLEDKTWGFQQYYQQNTTDGDTEYVQVEKPDIDVRYNLQTSQPSDWTSNFSSYYMKTSDGWTNVTEVETYTVVSSQPSNWYAGGYSYYYKLESGTYTNISKVQGLVVTTSQPANWENNCTNYCYSDGTAVEKVKHAMTYELQGSQPPDWGSNYGSYYQTDGYGNYSHVSGQSYTKKHAVLTTQQPTDWNNNYKNYWYYSSKSKKWLHPTAKKAPKWKANKYYGDYNGTKAPTWYANSFYTGIQPADTAPTWVSGTFYTDGEVVPAFTDQTVYEKSTIPTWAYNTYYTAEDYQPIPVFAADTYFIQYEDHYEALCEAAKKKIEEYMNKNELTITLDDTKIYDINDRVGASDEVTGLGAVERIVQKVVKIQKGIVSFDYNTGV